MRIEFAPQAVNHLKWLQEHKPKLAAKVLMLLDAIEQNSYQGLGKPEPLKHKYVGWWSRRISQEHRLVYRVDGDCIHVLQCRFHYDNK